MGRVRDLGSIDDVVEISRRTDWVRPVLDFAHMHATSDGAFLEAERFSEALAAVDAVLEPGAPFHIHFSDIAFANRNETKHLPYGEGTLRAEPLRDALASFERPATVISESPDEALESGDSLGARRRRRNELGEPRLVDGRVVVAATLAVEGHEPLEDLELGSLRSRPSSPRAPSDRAPRPRRHDPARHGPPPALPRS